MSKAADVMKEVEEMYPEGSNFTFGEFIGKVTGYRIELFGVPLSFDPEQCHYIATGCVEVTKENGEKSTCPVTRVPVEDWMFQKADRVEIQEEHSL